MDRRDFLKKTAAGALLATPVVATSVVAAPAIITHPTIQWRMASSYPKSLDTIHGAAEVLSRRVAELTDNRFRIRVFAPGDLVPGLQVMDAVGKGTCEAGHTARYYYVGKNKAFAFDTTVPFGLTARQQNAWLYSGGGRELMAPLFAEQGVISFPGGNTGAQMGGWFRREVRSLAELKGLKMRIPGIGGEIMSRLGVIPQTIAGADIYPALERGAIDATEWVGPYDDEKLGLYKIAKHYYFPGWWEPGPTLNFYVNQVEWKKLPPMYRAAFEAAAAEASTLMLANYDARNPEALARLIGRGVKLHRYPDDVLEAGMKATFEFFEEEAAKDPAFRKIYTEWKKFRRLQQGWFNLAESSLENFMYRRPIK